MTEYGAKTSRDRGPTTWVDPEDVGVSLLIPVLTPTWQHDFLDFDFSKELIDIPQNAMDGGETTG